uniref:Uncharacterized protein n=1 Tax=Schizaphis graminum TaxID=13262 RepID=A0A2S2PUI0_SCHGA
MMLKTLCASSPDDSHYRMVSPFVPSHPGPRNANEILSPYDYMLGMPNIPAIIGFANTIINAAPDAIPDYTISATFDDQQPHVINGHAFPQGNWTENDQSLLLQPGLHQTPETNPELDEQLNQHGYKLMLPTIPANAPTVTLRDFTCLSNIQWIENLLPTMTTYCSFFKESSNLSLCSPYGPTSSLLSSKMTQLTSDTAATNSATTLTSAFPDVYPFKLIYDQRSFEPAIP